jgi:hypothetical protein
LGYFNNQRAGSKASQGIEFFLSKAGKRYMKPFLTMALLAILSVSAQAHGSQEYAPDSYYRILAPTWAIDTSTKTKFKLPIGCIIHVLYFGTSRRYLN